MTHREQEEILRRALHAAADSIEPAADGLERIRERLSTPRPLYVAWLMGVWAGLAQPVLLRMEPTVADLAGRLTERLGAWVRAAAGFLGTVFVGLGPAGDRVLAALRRLRPNAGMSRHEKLRSALAFGAAAVIGAAGGFALSAGLPQQVISAASSFIAPSPAHHAGGGGPGSENGGGQNLPSTSGTSPHARGTASPSPSPSCKTKATQAPRPTPSGASPSPSRPSPSPSGASPSPTQASPSPSQASPSPSQTSGGTLSPPTPAPDQASDADMIVHGGNSSGKPTPTPAPGPTSTPAATPTCS